MKKYRLKDLGKIQLNRLRKDITLCSLFLDHYENRYQIDRNEVFNFFDSYADYLQELMIEDNHTDNEYFDLLPLYDTSENLYKFHQYVYNFD